VFVVDPGLLDTSGGIAFPLVSFQVLQFVAGAAEKQRTANTKAQTAMKREITEVIPGYDINHEMRLHDRDHELEHRAGQEDISTLITMLSENQTKAVLGLTIVMRPNHDETGVSPKEHDRLVLRLSVMSILDRLVLRLSVMSMAPRLLRGLEVARKSFTWKTIVSKCRPRRRKWKFDTSTIRQGIQ